MTRMSELQPDLVPSSSRTGGLAKVVIFLGARASLPARGSGGRGILVPAWWGEAPGGLQAVLRVGARGQGCPRSQEASTRGSLGAGLTLVCNQESQCGAIGEALRPLGHARSSAVEATCRARDFIRWADWLQERFSDIELRDVEGLVKLVDRTEIEAHDWSLTLGRYVGVAPEEENEDFDFEEARRSIHIDPNGLNTDATELAIRIARNFEKLRT